MLDMWRNGPFPIGVSGEQGKLDLVDLSDFCFVGKLEGKTCSVFFKSHYYVKFSFFFQFLFLRRDLPLGDRRGKHCGRKGTAIPKISTRENFSFLSTFEKTVSLTVFDRGFP